MSIRATVIMLALGAAAFGAQASSQTDKMKDCNVQAKTQSLAGDARKGFMKTCLSNAPAAAASDAKLTPQQQKMKTCNADAKARALKGDERKSYMKVCLSA
jgi:hypothetical protein